MGFSGSIVLKKTHLINMLSDNRAMWNSNLSRGARSNVFGQKIILDLIMEEDTRKYSWDQFLQDIWGKSTCDPGVTFSWLFSTDCAEERTGEPRGPNQKVIK